MRTTSIIATISYNTETNLIRVLNELVRKHEIDFWAFVKHFKEDDETKDHYHLLVFPSKQIDTNQLRDEFEELDPNNIKPLGCLPFGKSKFNDWYLYCSHDIRYLNSKGQTRKYHYQFSDFVTSDTDYLNELVHQIDLSKFNQNQIIVDAVQNNVPFSELVALGRVPVQMINQFRMMYELLQGNLTYRGVDSNGELIKSHTPKE